MKFYDSIKTAAAAKGETNDCSVRAMAIVLGRPYDEIHALYKACGRPDKRGTPWTTWARVEQEILARYNVLLHAYTPTKEHYIRGKKTTGRYTNKTIHKALPEGRFILEYRGHHAAMVDGVVEDWSEGRAKRINKVYAVVLLG